MADDFGSRLSVLETKTEEHERRVKEIEGRISESVDKSEGRVTARVEKLERNSLWIVMVVIAAVANKIMEKIGLG